MADRLKKLAVHFFLITLFFVLHVGNEYYGLIPAANIFSFLGYYTILSLALFFMGRLIFGSYIAGACWATGLLVVFYFFGATHDLIKDMLPGSFLSSYSFILPFTLLVLLIFSFVIHKRRNQLQRINIYLNILFCIFVLIEGAGLLYKSAVHRERDNDFSVNDSTIPERLQAKKERPDIFFVVFDEYASTKSIEKYQHFDNSRIDSILVANHFYISSNSKSNYNSTPFSLASTLTLNYFDKPLDYAKTTSKIRLQACYTLKMSKLFPALQKEGYRIVNLGLLDIKDHPVRTFEFSEPDKRRPLFLETIWGRTERDLGYHLYKYFPALARQSDSFHERSIQRNIINLGSAISELQSQDSNPKFVYVHVLLPHRPFYMDSLGTKRRTEMDGILYSDDSLYVNQLIYTNRWIADLAKAANQPFARPRVVIMEGDHGFRDLYLSKSTIFERQFMNFNAYYFSDHDYHLLYDSISPVNSFRVVLNKYFNSNFRLLKDSCIIMD